jgi:GcrA cell cycle regulator
MKKASSPAPAKKPAAAQPAPKSMAKPTTAPVSKSAVPIAKIAPKLPANAPGKPAEAVPLAALANMTSRADGKLVSILELTEKICRWPVGDPKEPGFGYCGAEAYTGHPYCAEHVAIAFQAPNRKDGKKIAKVVKPNEVPDLEDLVVEVEVEGEEEAEDDVTLVEDEDDTVAV